MESTIKTTKLEKYIKLLLITVLGTILITISAKVKIPFYPVPMTMQTFVIILMGITFGYKIGIATVTLYLFEGIIGLPVFASSPEKGVGLAYFLGPTMGYLIGFLVAVYFAGFFDYNKGKINTFFKILFSVSIIYLFGLIWLGTLIGWDKPIFKLGAQPFLLAELFKILLLVLLTPTLLNFKKFLKII
tara:strand:+ start:239 stop:802 length:564 start_codon:yes stop_codon:yes gene_type:complete